ncbi:DNA-binding response regulator in two-component regulatory system with PhoR (or CreC) [Tepidanaerobacter acetatoxydans Re1]|uniref:Stage 0 sporulation protein A homolog n=1 Tax=Tepidanaerobacter acetatoxydans (strain DSM 21804 / JCM 16047 / Re1) TaxID=1209989 RepID=F4LRR3_TEPAE|nr:response regulator transcription factor [Tepidanaerobacter acetatoxydans]AEE91131.1 two component transcriptional regulator, winged helix family [Tepidanaerobacter acetatoxydans Re1]CCP25796.1 DNA-binding response regulator in two-component regulatory system with PhoR (or CreC) [Tepidanaerobacter acetatoxydans Re1]
MEITKKAILVVDDEKNIRELVRFNLESRGYKVKEAMDGKEALSIARTDEPLLIILDLMLPKIDGLEVCRILKGDPSTKKIPIIMLTALGDEIDKIVGLELGADDYITKPFSPREMVARVRAVIRRVEDRRKPEEPEHSVNEFNDLVIDEQKHEVLLSGSRLDLTLKEYELLKVFAANPFNVFSREHLLEKVWGYDFMGDTRTVDVHVCNLRRKLEEADDKTGYYIETVRGVGYRFGYRE